MRTDGLIPCLFGLVLGLALISAGYLGETIPLFARVSITIMGFATCVFFIVEFFHLSKKGPGE